MSNGGDSSSQSWFLKTDDGPVYGPIKMSVLCDWAGQGRVAPGDLISSDQKQWIKAETLEDLGLNWVVELKNGQAYGPIHLHAIRDLVVDGVVISSAKITNKATGEVSTVAALVPDVTGKTLSTPFSFSPAAETKPDPVSAKQEAEHLRLREEAARAEQGFRGKIERLQAEVNAARKDFEKTVKELEKERAKSRELSIRAENSEKDFQDRMTKMQREGTLTAEQLDEEKRAHQHQREMYEAERTRAQRSEAGFKKQIEVLEEKCRVTDNTLRVAQTDLAAIPGGANGDPDWMGLGKSDQKGVAASVGERLAVLDREARVTAEILENTKKELEEQRVLYKSFQEMGSRQAIALNSRIERYQKESSAANDVRVKAEQNLKKAIEENENLIRQVAALRDDNTKLTSAAGQAAADMESLKATEAELRNENARIVRDLSEHAERIKGEQDRELQAVESLRGENQRREQELRDKMASMERERESLAKSLANTQEELKWKQGAYTALTLENEEDRKKFEGRVAQIEENRTALLSQIENLKREITGELGRCQRQEERVRQLENERASLHPQFEAERAALSSQIDSLKSEIATGLGLYRKEEERVGQLEAERVALLAQLETERAALSSQIDSLKSEIATGLGLYRKEEERVGQLEAERAALSNQIDNLKSEIATGLGLYRKEEERVGHLEAERAALSKQCDILRNDLAAEQDRSRSLSEALKTARTELLQAAGASDAFRVEIGRNVQEFTSRIQILEKERAALSSNLDQTVLNLNEERSRIQALSEQTSRKETDLAAEIGKLRMDVEQKAASIEKLKADLEHSVAAGRKLREDGERREEEAKGRIGALETERTSILASLAAATEKLNLEQRASASLSAANVALSSDMERLRVELAGAKASLDTAAKELEERAVVLESLHEQRTRDGNELNSRIQALEANLGSTIEARKHAERELGDLRRQRQEIIEKNAVRERELSSQAASLGEQLRSVTDLLERTRKDLDDRETAYKALQEERQRELEVRRKEIEDFKQLIVGEVAANERDVARDGEFLSALQSSFAERSSHVASRIEELRRLVGDEFETRMELCRKQKVALVELEPLRAELEQQKALFDEDRGRFAQVESDLSAEVNRLSEQNQALRATIAQVESDSVKNKTLAAELKDRSRSSENELAKRVEKLQEQNQELIQKLSESELRIEEQTKLLNDGEAESRRREDEIRQKAGVLEAELTDARQREVDLTGRLDEIRRKYNADFERSEQLEWESKRRETAYADEMSRMKESRDRMTKEIQDTSRDLEETRRQVVSLTEKCGFLEQSREERERELTDRVATLEKERQLAVAQVQEFKDGIEKEKSLQVELQVQGKQKEEVYIKRLQAMTEKLEATERQKKQLEGEQKRIMTLQEELQQQKKGLREEQLRVAELEQRLVEARRGHEETTLQEQQLQEELVRKQEALDDEKTALVQMETMLQQEKSAAAEEAAKSHTEIQELLQRIEQMQAVHTDTVAKLEESMHEFDREKGVLEDALRQRELTGNELRDQLTQYRDEYGSVMTELEQKTQQLEQQKIAYEDEQDHNRLKLQDLQQHVEQLTQEGKTIAVRLQQQKKFYDEERELRRQKEIELMQQKKVLQDLQTAARQKEQTFLHQKKLQDDELARARQKEEMLNRRLEQMQKDWRSNTGRVEQPPRESSSVQQRRDVTIRTAGRDSFEDETKRRPLVIEKPRTAPVETRRTFEKAELLPPVQAAESQSVLRSLEAKAQAELETLQRIQEQQRIARTTRPVQASPSAVPAERRDKIQEKIRPLQDEVAGSSSGDSQKNKDRFRVRPWISLK